MGKIEKFEDIEAWQEARELTKQIYAVSARGPLAKDFGMRDQMRRAALSVMSNIAEGFERGGDNEFAQFLAHAKGSSGELRAQLYAALDQGYLDTETFNRLMELATKINRILSGLIKYLRTSELKGSKYRKN